MNELKQQIKGTLGMHRGKARAITARELSRITQHPDRAVRLAIRELIADGVPILSSTLAPAGYFLPLNWYEVTDCMMSLKNRLIEDARRRRDLKRAAGLYLATARQDKLL